MAKTRRQYSGGAVATTVTSSVSAVATVFAITANTGWPSAAGVPFYIVLSPQTSVEEKMLVTISGTTLTVVSRGVDGTTASSHASGAAIYPVITAIDLDEANELSSKYATRGSMVFQGASTFQELAVGTQGYPLVAGANDPAYAQLGTTGIADDAITAAKIAANAVGASEISSGAVGSDELATNAVTTAKITDLNVTTAKIADSSVTLAKLAAAVANTLVPVGTIAMYGGVTAPTGWLLCDGSAISGSYTALQAIVGANTPDFKGRFAIGDNSTLTLLGTGGSTTISEANLPAHSHANTATASTSVSLTDPGHSHNLADMGTNPADNAGTNGFVLTGASADLQGGARGTASASTGITVSGATTTVTMSNAPTGSGTAYYQPHLVVNYIIKHD